MALTRDALIAIAADAGAHALAAWVSFDRATVEFKSDTDLVTHVDRAVQERIVTAIHRRDPEARIVAEEQPDAGSVSTDPTYIIDPVDGTTNFVHGLPHWCVSIGYWVDGEAHTGVVAAPALGEIYSAERGAGAWLRRDAAQGSGGSQETALRVSAAATPRHALGCSGIFGASDAMRAGSARLMEQALGHLRDVRRHGAAALDLCFVAAGRYDLFWEGHLHAWDIAAGALIAREAGGVVTDLAGTDQTPTQLLEAGNVLAGTPSMHRWFLDTLTWPQ